MTKKHFVAFADYIREAPVSQEIKTVMARMVVSVAVEDNPQFDARRFMRAAGLLE